MQILRFDSLSARQIESLAGRLEELEEQSTGRDPLAPLALFEEKHRPEDPGGFFWLSRLTLLTNFTNLTSRMAPEPTQLHHEAAAMFGESWLTPPRFDDDDDDSGPMWELEPEDEDESSGLFDWSPPAPVSAPRSVDLDAWLSVLN